MGYLDSPVHAVERVRFNPIKSVEGVTDIVRLTKTGSTFPGSVFILTKRGAVYTNDSLGRNMCLTGRTNEYAAALAGLGLITKDELRVHKGWVAARKAWEDTHDMLKRFKERAHALGIILTPEQVATCDKEQANADRALETVRIAARRLNADRLAAEAKSKS